MLKFLGWYSLVMLIFSLITTIGKDGKDTINYTGKFKLSSIMLKLPIVYFIYYCLSNLL